MSLNLLTQEEIKNKTDIISVTEQVLDAEGIECDSNIAKLSEEKINKILSEVRKRRRRRSVQNEDAVEEEKGQESPLPTTLTSGSRKYAKYYWGVFSNLNSSNSDTKDNNSGNIPTGHSGTKNNGNSDDKNSSYNNQSTPERMDSCPRNDHTCTRYHFADITFGNIQPNTYNNRCFTFCILVICRSKIKRRTSHFLKL